MILFPKQQSQHHLQRRRRRHLQRRSHGMGDWDGCHYIPGSIGSTLRVLQDQDVVEFDE